MSYSSSIRHPEKNSFIQLHEWQVQFCQDNRCAALLLSYFAAWHDWKFKNDWYYQKANDIAEMHGDGRPHNENAYLFFTTEQLIDGCMGIFGKTKVHEALELLVDLKVITIHHNPIKRYHFDKTKYFKFYPQICNQWISENYPINSTNHHLNSQPIEKMDVPKSVDRSVENNHIDQPILANRSAEVSRRSAENSRRSAENGSLYNVTNTTNNTTNKNQSMNACGDFFEIAKQKTEAPAEENKPLVQAVLVALVAKGLPPKRLRYSDTAASIQRLLDMGATIEQFEEAFELAVVATCKQGKVFGLRYLIKVVASLLDASRSPKNTYRPQPSTVLVHNSLDSKSRHFVSDFSKGLDWMGDLVEEDSDEFTTKN